jgi:hypothetical protein
MRASDQLAAFVGDALAQSRTRDEIARALREAGWSEPEVKAALEAWAETQFVPPVPRPRPAVTARDAFAHALLFVALAITAWHITALGFALIDRWLPETGETPGLWDRGRIRWSVATLIVVFPFFLYLGHRLRRDARSEAARRRSPPRKWVGYTVLFLAALALAGDLIAVIYAFLSGDLTARFLAKAALVALTAGLIYLYFHGELQEREDAA